MSDVYVYRLRGVRDEYYAAREAVAYINRNWQRLNTASDIDGLTPKHFANSAQSLETVFIIRLFSTFEGVLKEHLAKNHPPGSPNGIVVAEDERAIRLIARVASR